MSILIFSRKSCDRLCDLFVPSYDVSAIFSLAGLKVNVKIENEIEDEDEEMSGDEYQEVIPIGTPTKWDCESILSTYSNIYNHPTLIKDPPRIDKVGVSTFPRVIQNSSISI